MVFLNLLISRLKISVNIYFSGVIYGIKSINQQLPSLLQQFPSPLQQFPSLEYYIFLICLILLSFKTVKTIITNKTTKPQKNLFFILIFVYFSILYICILLVFYRVYKTSSLLLYFNAIIDRDLKAF